MRAARLETVTGLPLDELPGNPDAPGGARRERRAPRRSGSPSLNFWSQSVDDLLRHPERVGFTAPPLINAAGDYEELTWVEGSPVRRHG